MGTNREIRERRESVFIMVSKGMHQNEMAEKLNVAKSTISYDVKAIMENSDQKLNELVRKMMPYMYEKSLMGINEVLRECWNIYNSQDPHITQWHKQAALRLAKDCNKEMFELFSDGPMMAKVADMTEEIRAIKEDAVSRGYISELDSLGDAKTEINRNPVLKDDYRRKLDVP